MYCNNKQSSESHVLLDRLKDKTHSVFVVRVYSHKTTATIGLLLSKTTAPFSARFILAANANAIRMLTSHIRNEQFAGVPTVPTLLEYCCENTVATSNYIKFALHSHAQEV